MSDILIFCIGKSNLVYACISMDNHFKTWRIKVCLKGHALLVAVVKVKQGGRT
jgi:hypothetical protein